MVAHWVGKLVRELAPELLTLWDVEERKEKEGMLVADCVGQSLFDCEELAHCVTMPETLHCELRVLDAKSDSVTLTLAEFDEEKVKVSFAEPDPRPDMRSDGVLRRLAVADPFPQEVVVELAHRLAAMVVETRWEHSPLAENDGVTLAVTDGEGVAEGVYRAPVDETEVDMKPVEERVCKMEMLGVLVTFAESEFVGQLDEEEHSLEVSDWGVDFVAVLESVLERDAMGLPVGDLEDVELRVSMPEALVDDVCVVEEEAEGLPLTTSVCEAVVVTLLLEPKEGLMDEEVVGSLFVAVLLQDTVAEADWQGLALVEPETPRVTLDEELEPTDMELRSDEDRLPDSDELMVDDGDGFGDTERELVSQVERVWERLIEPEREKVSDPLVLRDGLCVRDSDELLHGLPVSLTEALSSVELETLLLLLGGGEVLGEWDELYDAAGEPEGLSLPVEQDEWEELGLSLRVRVVLREEVVVLHCKRDAELDAVVICVRLSEIVNGVVLVLNVEKLTVKVALPDLEERREEDTDAEEVVTADPVLGCDPRPVLEEDTHSEGEEESLRDSEVQALDEALTRYDSVPLALKNERGVCVWNAAVEEAVSVGRREMLFRAVGELAGESVEDAVLKGPLQLGRSVCAGDADDCRDTRVVKEALLVELAEACEVPVRRPHSLTAELREKLIERL
jgi:hypothetical protein